MHGPGDGASRDLPAAWHPGYLDAVEWRWIEGSVRDPGPGVVWMRPTVELVEGTPMSPVQRLLCCVGSASGVWPGAVGVATSRVHDRQGLVARSAQALLVTRR